jgi:hypothetical protein
MDFAGHEQGFEVGDRIAGGEVAQVRLVVEHGRQLSDDLSFHRRAGRAAVQGVVVGVDQHRREMADHGHGVGRLEYLARVVRVEEESVVLQTAREQGEGLGEALVVHLEGRVGPVG